MDDASQRSNKPARLIVAALFLLLSASIVSAAPAGFGQISVSSNCPSNLCPFFDNPNGVWVFNWVADGYTSDYVNAYFTPQDLESETGSEPEQSFSIGIDGTKNSCQYDVQREANREDIYTVRVASAAGDFWAWDCDIECTQERAQEAALGINPVMIDTYSDGLACMFFFKDGLVQNWYEVYCFQKVSQLGLIGSLKNLKYVTETKWTVTSEGKPQQSATISNGATGSGKTSRIGNDVLVQWQGLLSSGENCPVPDTELMAYGANYAGNWRVIDRFDYISYENFMNSELKTLLYKVGCGENELGLECNPTLSRSSAEYSVNSLAQQAAAEKSFSGYTVQITDSSLNSGALKIDLSRLIRFPLFRLFVDSDYLELNVPVGVPDITCPSTVKFAEGEQGKIEVTAKNVGDAAGSFTIRVAQCDSGFQPGDSTGTTLSASESESVLLKTTAQTQQGQTLTGNCVIEMKEATSQQSDTCTVHLEATKPLECTIGNVWCGFEDGFSVIKECPAGTEQVVKVCAADEICDTDELAVPFCKKVGGGGGDTGQCQNCEAYVKSKILGGLFESEKCTPKLLQNDVLCAVAYGKLAVVPLAFILVTVFAYNYFSQIKSFRKHKKGNLLALLVSVPLGVIIAFLAYSLFTLGLILAVVAIIGFLILKKVRVI